MGRSNAEKVQEEPSGMDSLPGITIRVEYHQMLESGSERGRTIQSTPVEHWLRRSNGSMRRSGGATRRWKTAEDSIERRYRDPKTLRQENCGDMPLPMSQGRVHEEGCCHQTGAPHVKGQQKEP